MGRIDGSMRPFASGIDGLAAALAPFEEAGGRLLARATRIKDPAWRERFLACVPDNARTLALSG